MEVEYAQDSNTTYMYPVNTRKMSYEFEVREGVVWWWGKEGELILGFPLKFFWGKYPAGMTYHPKEANMS